MQARQRNLFRYAPRFREWCFPQTRSLIHKECIEARRFLWRALAALVAGLYHFLQAIRLPRPSAVFCLFVARPACPHRRSRTGSRIGAIIPWSLALLRGLPG